MIAVNAVNDADDSDDEDDNEELKNEDVYIHDLREVTNKRDSELWTKKIPFTSRIAYPCFGLNTNSVVTCTICEESGREGTTTVTAWDFSGDD